MLGLTCSDTIQGTVVLHRTKQLQIQYKSVSLNSFFTKSQSSRQQFDDTNTIYLKDNYSDFTNIQQVQRPIKDKIEDSEDLTVYTLRIITKDIRDAGITDFNSEVCVCILGGNGQAILHTIPQIYDAAQQSNFMQETCEIVGDQAGVDCGPRLTQRRLKDPLQQRYQQQQQQQLQQLQQQQQILRRFQRASIDEVSIIAHNLNEVKAIIIGPQKGEWQVQEVILNNSKTGQSNYFYADMPQQHSLPNSQDQRQKSNAHQKQNKDFNQEVSLGGAAYLLPLKNGYRKYGSHKDAKIISEDQSKQMTLENNQDYVSMKEKLLKLAVASTVIGGIASQILGGQSFSIPYLAGGTAGIVSQISVIDKIDRLMDGSEYNNQLRSKDSDTQVERRQLIEQLQDVYSSPYARTSLTILGGVIIWYITQSIQGQGKEIQIISSHLQVHQIFLAALGYFLSKKISVIGIISQPLNNKIQEQQIK